MSYTRISFIALSGVVTGSHLVKNVNGILVLYEGQKTNLMEVGGCARGVAVERARNSYIRGRASTVDLLVQSACFVWKEKYFSVKKVTDLN